MGKPKHAVVIVSTPPEFKPTHLHAIPPTFSDPTFFVKNVALHAARDVAQAYNREHLPCTGAFESRWALVIYGLRRTGNGRRPT